MHNPKKYVSAELTYKPAALVRLSTYNKTGCFCWLRIWGLGFTVVGLDDQEIARILLFFEVDARTIL